MQQDHGNTARQHALPVWLGRVALVLGLAIGLVALLAPLGIWLGLWAFGTGFAILGAVVPYSAYVALTCLLLGAAAAILASAWNTGRPGRLAAYGLIGALAAAIAWYIPNSFQAPEGENYPPIHDISTDTDNPPQFVAVVPIREEAGAANTVEYGGTPDVTPQQLANLQREAYPDIQPVMLDAPPAQAFDRALAAVEEMGWDVVEADAGAGRIEATDTTFWFRFKDDIVIRLMPAAGGGTRVDARSVSRVGRGDVGTNAKRLRAYFETLNELG